MGQISWGTILSKLPGGTDVGTSQTFTTTIDLEQAAASYTLWTGTTADFIVEDLTIRLPAVDVSDDATITSISIQTDDATPAVIINTTTGAVANLTSEAQIGFSGVVHINVASIIQITIAGGAADAATVCEITVRGFAAASGGTLV